MPTDSRPRKPEQLPLVVVSEHPRKLLTDSKPGRPEQQVSEHPGRLPKPLLVPDFFHPRMKRRHVRVLVVEFVELRVPLEMVMKQKQVVIHVAARGYHLGSCFPVLPNLV